MVTHEEEDGDTTGGQPVNAFGKLPLLSLTRLAALIGITAEEDKVYPVLQGIVHNLVKGRQEVKEACRQPGSRVNASVAFHTQVKVGKVEDFQPLPPLD